MCMTKDISYEQGLTKNVTRKKPLPGKPHNYIYTVIQVKSNVTGKKKRYKCKLVLI